MACALRVALRPASDRFARSLWDPARAQARVSAALLERLHATEYGRNFVSWDHVPVVDYEALSPWIERQRGSDACVLVADPIVAWERTSGSSGAVKHIPYTRAMLRSFTRMFGVWMADLLNNGPRFTTGRCYFSVSPSFARPTGLPDDRAYLSGWLAWVMRPFWVTMAPADLAAGPDGFWERLATRLVRERRLEVISVWSPAFLAGVLDWLDTHPAAWPDPAMAGSWSALWPHLKLVSCWDAAGASTLADRLRVRLPGVVVQGKGLLATEAPLTVPLVGRGFAPLIGEVLIELEQDDGRLVPIAAADPGGEYGVVVSQCAGLTRYRLGDRVRATTRLGETVGLELIGRVNVSDLVGEKLNDVFVAGVLRACGGGVLVARVDHYVWVVDTPVAGGADRVEALLNEAHHYAVARRLGQLRPVRMVVLPDAVHRTLTAGRVWGGTKPGVLRRDAPEFAPWLD